MKRLKRTVGYDSHNFSSSSFMSSPGCRDHVEDGSKKRFLPDKSSIIRAVIPSLSTAAGRRLSLMEDRIHRERQLLVYGLSTRVHSSGRAVSSGAFQVALTA